MNMVLDKTIEEDRRRIFLEKLNDDFAALRANPDAWREELEERTLWEQTLADGLEDEPTAGYRAG